MEIFDYGLEADSEEYDSADSDTDFKPWSGVVHNTGWMGPAQPAHDKEVEDVFEATSLSLKEGVAMLREMADPTMIRMETPAHLLVAGTTLKNFQAHTLTILHHDYQKSKEVRRRNGMLLGQEMGTGKTIVTLALIASIPPIPGVPHLIVVPLSLVDVWESEIKKHMNPIPKYCVYSRKTHTLQQLKDYAIVIATYDKVSNEGTEYERTRASFEARRASSAHHEAPIRCNNTLATMSWNIVVADEGHAINNTQTQKHRSLDRLNSLYRLPLTGTPFANEYKSLQSYMAYLGVTPWEDENLFKKYFLFKRSKDISNQLLSSHVNAILAAVFASFTIRIRKTDLFEGRPIADFTEGVKFTYGHGLTENERRLQAKTRTLWDHGLRAHNKANRIGGFMEWKTALKDVGDARLGIVHHLCLKYRYSEEGDANEALGEKTANIPTEDIIDTMRKTKGTLSSEGQVNRVLLRAATKRSWRESSRIVVSMNIMRRHFEQHGWESQLVIFSDYLSALDVLENAILELFKDRVRIARYDGTVDAETRAAHAKAFQDGRINLFLATTKAGGYGLTLTKANGVLHLTEPWNPGAAEQCTARAIRIGTDHTVYVYVPYAHDSIERRIKLIAKMKLRKASKVVDPDASMRARMAEVSAYTREQLRSKMDEAKALSSEYNDRLEKKLRTAGSSQQDRFAVNDLLADLTDEELISAESELEKDFQELRPEADDVTVDASLLEG